MAAVYQMPRTHTNPTDKYRVIDYRSWLDYCDGSAASYTIYSEHDDLPDAIEEARRLNAELSEG